MKVLDTGIPCQYDGGLKSCLFGKYWALIDSLILFNGGLHGFFYTFGFSPV